ncbi:hypothetical protein H0E87_008007 [Populus deltoides]|uniref:T-complex protein 1 subunit eta n=1 Tax=Populus deltoides TaxID=3696 RepID=A0A8T2YZ51_POPDE|nr:hypothetical protein H0E87_008007 [Populus deltoides]
MDFSALQARPSTAAYFPLHRTQLHPRMHSFSSTYPPQQQSTKSQKTHKLLALLATLLTIPFLFYLFSTARKIHHSSKFSNPNTRFFSVVIDSGRAGCRVRVYQLLGEGNLGFSNGQLPLVTGSMKVRPGLAGFAEDPDNAGGLIEGLVEFAKKRVPRRDWGNAGVQLMVRGEEMVGLEGKLKERILEVCRKVLRGSGLAFKDEWARVIEEEERGVYSWVAVNYVHGTMGSEPHKTTGMVELGGNSLLITFASREAAQVQSSRRIKLAGVAYNLQAQSLPKFGQFKTLFGIGVFKLKGRNVLLGSSFSPIKKETEGVRRVYCLRMEWDHIVCVYLSFFVICILQQLCIGFWCYESSSVEEASVYRDGFVGNPCIPKGYEMAYNISDPKLLLSHGAGNFTACRIEVLALLKSRQEKCLHPPCNVVSPFFMELQSKPVSQNNVFYASEFFGLVPRVSLFELEAAGKHYCEDDWDKLKDQHHSIDDLDLLRYCFSSAYTVALLHDSLGVSMNDKRYYCSPCTLALVLLSTFFQYLGKPSCVENGSKLDMVKVCRSKPIGFANNTESVPFDWTLGALIFQSMLEPLESEINNLDEIVGDESVTGSHDEQQPQIILLKEGTDTSQGKAQLVSNINACTAVADVVRTTLGPRGMDKLIHDDKGNVTISNDGATIMKLLDIIHPASKILVDIAKSQDSEVGDGTTTVVLLAGEFLKEAKPFVEEGVHPQNLIRSYRTACNLAIEKVKELAVSIEGKSLEEKKSLLAKCAATTLSSKLIGGEKEFFASMVVDAVIAIGNDDRLNMIGIKKVPGGTMRDSFLVNGVAFKKTFSYAGFEQQPKKFVNPKILLLNIELELKSEKENAEIRLSDPSQYQSIVDAEWNIIYDKLDKCVQSGAKVVLSRLAIGDLATQYFADRDIFCAGRVSEEDLQRVSAASGGTVQTTVNNIIDEVLGTCEIFEEKQVGNERFNIFSGCPSGRTATIVLRGGADQFIEEAERSLHDAIMIVRRAMKNSTVVAGGGAIDMEISRYLRQHARTIAGKSQLFINSYAKALEVIPRQLCDNAGFDATDVLNKLRQKHALPSGEGAPYGVDINTGGIADSFSNFVWEPSVVKINAINAATEAACLILSVDETVKNPKSESAQGEAAAGAMGGRGGGGFRGRGRGMRRR